MSGSRSLKIGRYLAGIHLILQNPEIPFGLVGVGGCKIGDCFGEDITTANLTRDGSLIARSSVGPGQAHGAHTHVSLKAVLVQGARVDRAFHIFQLSPIIMDVGSRILMPAQEYVA